MPPKKQLNSYDPLSHISSEPAISREEGEERYKYTQWQNGHAFYNVNRDIKRQYRFGLVSKGLTALAIDESTSQSVAHKELRVMYLMLRSVRHGSYVDRCMTLLKKK